MLVTYYYAVDGDNIGRRLEYLIITNDEAGAARFSREIEAALLLIAYHLGQKGAKIIFAGGDNLLARTEDWIEPKTIPMHHGEITFSLGIGRSPLSAMLALKRAKVESPGSYFLNTEETMS